jgi:hypothetical protein
MVNCLLAIRDTHREHNLEIYQNDKTESPGQRKVIRLHAVLGLCEIVTIALRMARPLFSSVLVEIIQHLSLPSMPPLTPHLTHSH